MLVVHVDEVLDGVDVAEPDRGILAKTLPIIQRIAVVTQDRRTLEPPRSVDERLGDVARERLRRLRTDLVDIGGGQKADTHIIEAKARQGFVRDGAFPLGNVQGARIGPKRLLMKQAGKIAPDLIERGVR